jgi:hypothetical protein
MIPWKYTRMIIVLTWLTPICIFLVNIGTDYVKANSDEGPLVWEKDVQSLEKGDAKNPPPANPVLFLGARQVTLWRQLSDYLEPLPILRRGVGSANIEDMKYYYDRLVLPYDPRAVVIVPSQADFNFRGKKIASLYSMHFRHLTQDLLEELPEAKLYVISPTKAPYFPDSWPDIDRANKELAEYADSEPRVTYINVVNGFQNASGDPTPSTFRSDGIFYSEWGYMRLSAAVLNQLEADFPQFFTVNSEAKGG